MVLSFKNNCVSCLLGKSMTCNMHINESLVCAILANGQNELFMCANNS